MFLSTGIAATKTKAARLATIKTKPARTKKCECRHILAQARLFVSRVVCSTSSIAQLKPHVLVGLSDTEARGRYSELLDMEIWDAPRSVGYRQTTP